MKIFLLFFCIFLGVVQTVCLKQYSKKTTNSIISFTMMSALMSFIFFLARSRFKFDFNIHAATVICSLLCAFGYICAFIGLNRALQHGALSLSTLIYTFSLFVPAVYGILILKEPIGKLFFLGMPLLIVSLIFVYFVNEKNRMNYQWIAWILIAFLGNALFATTQKVHQLSMNGEYGNELMMLTLSIVVISLAIYIFLFKKEKFGQSGKYIYWAVIHGLLNGANNYCLLVLAITAAASLVYPFVTGGTLVFVSLISYTFYKEKLLIRQWLGVGAGIVAVILLAI